MTAAAHLFAITLTVLVLLAPAASAGWRMFGSFEPDTSEDAAGGFMHLDPDAAPGVVGKVYFNAELGYDQAGINPNVGALDTRLMLHGYQLPHAFLGVWKDCNDDGYIGYAAGALMEYRSELLLDATAICPVGQDAHNANGWVYEFLPIGSAENTLTPSGVAPRLINDTGAYVWGDTGLPGSPRPQFCFVNPPTGTFSSTGAFIGWADCMNDHRLYDTVAAVDPSGDLNLKWDERDEPHCDDSALTSVKLGLWDDAPQCPDDDPGTFEENTGRPMFTAFDCSEPTFVANDPTGVTRTTVQDPTGGEVPVLFEDGEYRFALSDENGDIHSVYPPQVPTLDPEGSAYDALNATDAALTGGCEQSAFVLHATPESEAGNELSVQRQTTFPMQMWNDAGNSLLFGFDDIFGLGETPPYGGIAPLRSSGLLMPLWTSGILATDSTLVRDDLQPAARSHYTFYARVALPELLEGTPGATGIYGSEWCNLSQDPTLNGGFDCDPDNWWDTTKGASAMPTEVFTGKPIGQAPGAGYQLRDIDCYDGTLFGPVKLGLADISDEGGCVT